MDGRHDFVLSGRGCVPVSGTALSRPKGPVFMQARVKQSAGKMRMVAAVIVLAALCGEAPAQTNSPVVAHVTRCDLFSHGMTVGTSVHNSA